VLIIDRVGASPQYAWAIQVTNWSMNKPEAWERRLVIELNELLAENKPQASAAADAGVGREDA
jgi:hypothetical protein